MSYFLKSTALFFCFFFGGCGGPLEKGHINVVTQPLSLARFCCAPFAAIWLTIDGNLGVEGTPFGGF